MINNTALLVIDMQNGFINEKSPLCIRGAKKTIPACSETIDRCRAAGDKAMRLDLIDLNRPAEKVYLKLGFVHCASVELYYEEVGWQFFHMFELAL